MVIVLKIKLVKKNIVQKNKVENVLINPGIVTLELGLFFKSKSTAYRIILNPCLSISARSEGVGLARIPVKQIRE